ncbi:MAG: beta-CASP ribonuclease aCPSF1 [Candidatus Aenigmarchaeota archaeon]|nr:beta-CASP ribonuclease aCPSF1 [Candidatus Aenigmarchaeota archaeon]
MEIFDKIKEGLPPEADISDISFEGSEIVVYTKNKEFYTQNGMAVRRLVDELKKRIEVRPDLSMTMDIETASAKIKEIVPEDAKIRDIYFEPELGKVIIEAEKPGLVIGKGGETLRTIKSTIFWSPQVERAPILKSDIVSSVRKTLHSETKYRKEFLNKVGMRIHAPKKPGEQWIRLSALGGYREVGRSCGLVQTPESNILLDCGADVSSNQYPYFNAPEFDIAKLDAVVLSHAHLDHSGMVPFLYEQGYKGPLYTTAPTRDLMVMLCLDYIDVCQREGRFVPYTSKGIKEAVKHCITLDYGEVSDITPDVRLTLQNAGHLLGSALVHLHIGDGLYNILYTGDLRYEKSRVFEQASTDFARVETLIIESTYGGSSDVLPSRLDAEKSLLTKVGKVMQRGGKVLIPSFAVERAQELMVILQENNFDKPIYLDGMLWDAAAVYTVYPEFMSREIQRKTFHEGENPFLSPIFKRIASQKEREEVMNSKEPCVVIATSGMLIGGPAVEYLKAFAEDGKNGLLFVGYQGAGTLGNRIQKGWRELPVQTENGKTTTLKINMEVDTVDGLSGHSDRSKLINFIYKLHSRPERIVLCHLDPSKANDFAKTLHRMFKCEAIAPKVLDAIRLK